MKGEYQVTTATGDLIIIDLLPRFWLKTLNQLRRRYPGFWLHSVRNDNRRAFSSIPLRPQPQFFWALDNVPTMQQTKFSPLWQFQSPIHICFGKWNGWGPQKVCSHPSCHLSFTFWGPVRSQLSVEPNWTDFYQSNIQASIFRNIYPCNEWPLVKLPVIDRNPLCEIIITMKSVFVRRDFKRSALFRIELRRLGTAALCQLRLYQNCLNIKNQTPGKEPE
jgi:hypothetical protein